MAPQDDGLGKRIEAEIAVAHERIAEFQRKAERRHEEMEKRRDRFKEVAATLLQRIGRPVDTLASYFEHAEVSRSDDRTGRHAIVRFKHTPRFPASVELRFDVTHDEEVRRVIVMYSASILPIFLEYEKSDHISFDLDAVDEEKLRRWFEERIVGFVRTYLRIQFAEEYQKENLVTDPVAQVRFSRVFAKGTSEYAGHTYHFVSDETRAAFEEDPGRYVRA